MYILSPDNKTTYDQSVKKKLFYNDKIKKKTCMSRHKSLFDDCLFINNITDIEKKLIQ
jgi:hypothetical protein